MRHVLADRFQPLQVMLHAVAGDSHQVHTRAIYTRAQMHEGNLSRFKEYHTLQQKCCYLKFLKR